MNSSCCRCCQKPRRCLLTGCPRLLLLHLPDVLQRGVLAPGRVHLLLPLDQPQDHVHELLRVLADTGLRQNSADGANVDLSPAAASHRLRPADIRQALPPLLRLVVAEELCQRLQPALVGDGPRPSGATRVVCPRRCLFESFFFPANLYASLGKCVLTFTYLLTYVLNLKPAEF